MQKRQKHFGIFVTTFLIFFLSLTLFNGSGISLSIHGVAPVMVLSVLFPFCVYNDVGICAGIGFLCGAVMDSTSAGGFCFNSVAILILAVSANLLSNAVFNRNLKAGTVLCFMLTVVYYLFYWLIFIAFSLKFGGNLKYLLQSAMPSSLYTAVLSIPFYFIFKSLKNKKEKEKI